MDLNIFVRFLLNTDQSLCGGWLVISTEATNLRVLPDNFLHSIILCKIHFFWQTSILILSNDIPVFCRKWILKFQNLTFFMTVTDLLVKAFQFAGTFAAVPDHFLSWNFSKLETFGVLKLTGAGIIKPKKSYAQWCCKVAGKFAVSAIHMLYKRPSQCLISPIHTTILLSPSIFVLHRRTIKMFSFYFWSCFSTCIILSFCWNAETLSESDIRPWSWLWLQLLSQFLSPTSDIQTYSLVLNHFMFHLFPSSLFFSWTSEFCSSWIILFSSLSRTPPRYSAQYTHYITTSIVTFNISWLWSAECVWT